MKRSAGRFAYVPLARSCAGPGEVELELLSCAGTGVAHGQQQVVRTRALHGQSLGPSPEALATGRVTAARSDDSAANRVTCRLARVTAV